MTITLLRRALTWTALTLFLIAIGQALVAVWTANEREWYIDGAGMSATLDMSFSDSGRWLATAILGALGLLCLVALGADLASSRRAAVLRRPQTGREPQSVTYTPVTAAPVRETAGQPRLGRYEATVLGDDITKRVECSLPPDGGRDAFVDERPSQPIRPRTSVDILDSIGQVARRSEIARFRASAPEAPSHAFDTVPLQMANRR